MLSAVDDKLDTRWRVCDQRYFSFKVNFSFSFCI